METMLMHFGGVVINSIFFVIGWIILYGLFYKEKFAVNMGESVLGGAVFLASLACIGMMPYAAYLIFNAGILGLVIKNFFIVLFFLVMALAIVGVILELIHEIDQRFFHGKRIMT